MAAPPPLPGVLSALTPLLNHWGYLAVGGVVFVEDFGVPVPGETVLIAASVYAGAGRLNVFGVALMALCAAVLGDNVGYAIGRFGGHRLVERYGRYVFLTPERIARVESFFGRYGAGIVVVARFVEGLRQANGIIAGLARMPWPRFLVYNALGAVMWVGAWVALGDLTGKHIGTVYRTIQRYEGYVLLAVAVLVVALVVRHVRGRRRGPSRTPERQPERQED
ncbi:DedA family protein [Streptomyces sp. PTM05]|uniref:DedA family protein n=1 Tax=Streptantibioticus parmotrematis TaxID=2873249 RepID=A0ABS7QTC4_9ACTN|nr:DedA family protein [Streptantibioticus parmotrematis]MBY8885991.1 DedA family protein [Streptantibioticus parmotrematis]